MNVTTAFAAFLLIAAAWMIVSGYTSINAVVKAELFPTNVRALGVGLPYALTVSIFGGTADSAALWFRSIGLEEWFYYYLTLIIGISLVVYLFVRDTKAGSPPVSAPKHFIIRDSKSNAGNKDVAMKIGACYSSARWHALPGFDLSAFGERGWLQRSAATEFFRRQYAGLVPDVRRGLPEDHGVRSERRLF